MSTAPGRGKILDILQGIDHYRATMPKAMLASFSLRRKRFSTPICSILPPSVNGAFNAAVCRRMPP